MVKRSVVLITVLAVVVLTGGALKALAQQPPPAPEPPAEPDYILPFASDPGTDSWYIVQWYGNTTTAYHYRVEWYRAGQGLHFGLDLSAPCGTEIRAIQTGTVAFVDDEGHGAGPHNLMIDHPDGFSSLYGHLLERTSVEPGDVVQQGDVVALSGDPDLSCTSRPHLHLEIRDKTRHYAYNPVDFIDADWDTLSLFGPRSGFQRDLEHPDRWLTPYDQPIVDFWSPMVNDYWNVWPPDWAR